MEIIKRLPIATSSEDKGITVLCGDISELKTPIDVMTVSAFLRNYEPVPRTMIGGLYNAGVSVRELSRRPAIDLRDFCNIWLSEEIPSPSLPIKRIGCIELLSLDQLPPAGQEDEHSLLNAIKSYFSMLDIAANAGAGIETLGLPMLGTGSQNISDNLVMIPIINESIRFLERNESVREVYLFSRRYEKAKKIADQLDRSYSILRDSMAPAAIDQRRKDRPLVFISYSSPDRNVADNLCAKLEARGLRVWYAPRNVDKPDYATAIVNAISRCTHFAVIISRSSLASEHVLNEIDLAFQETKRGIRFYPLRLDQEALGPAFKYYLSRQHWMDASFPPLEERLGEFVGKILQELDD